MAGKGLALMRPLWMKQAEEAKVKEEEEKAAAARVAFDATFNDVDQSKSIEELSSDSEEEEAERLANKPIGPVDASKCTAAGTGVGGGAAGAAASFVVITKDLDGRRVPHGGANIKVKVAPGPGVGCVEQEALVKDHADGTYTATYAVSKRGDYMVSVECNGQPISGSPFPVFFSGGNALGGSLLHSSGASLSTSFLNGMSQGISPFPNMMTGIFPGMLALIPGILPGATGGAILPGLGASFGEVCRDYLNGRCVRSDCKYNHPPQNQLMAALAAGTTMGGLGQMPMAPSAAAMAAAQSIAAAQAYQAAQAQAVAQQQQAATKESKDKTVSSKQQEKKVDPSTTLQITNFHSSLTSEQLRQLFAYCGTVTDCEIDSLKQIAYVEYSKPDEAKAGLALNNLEVGRRALKVEPVKSPQPKPAATASAAATMGAQQPPLPMMMQQAVAMQQLQFQQALLMQQAMASQQAAARAATVKSASDMAAARAAEISKRLKGDDDGQEDKPNGSDRSHSISKSKSRSRSPVKYRRDRGRRSRSTSPIRYRRDLHRGSSRLRDHFPHRSYSRDRGTYYRGGRDGYSRYRERHEWDQERERDHHIRSSHSRRSRSRSKSRTKRRSRTHSRSPRRQSLSPNVDVSKSKSLIDESAHQKKSSLRHKKHRENPSRVDAND